MESLRFLLLLVISLVVISLVVSTHGTIASPGSTNAWTLARATFYGDMSGGETRGGACGYKDVFAKGYGLQTAALSPALFNGGVTCGSCYEIMCVNNARACIRGARIRVTVTNLCPANYSKTHDIWCNPPQKHFDLSMPMFVKIAQYKAGVVPVAYRRIRCIKRGGIKFEITGNQYWMLVLVFNVAGAGDVTALRIKGSRTNWIPMKRNWGQNWQTNQRLQGQSLSFEVRTSDGQILHSYNVAPKNWRLGQAYVATNNFR